MNFTQALEAIKAGGAVSVPSMPGCTVFVGADENGAPTICMQAPNGKLVRNWLPAALLSDEWQAAEKPAA